MIYDLSNPYHQRQFKARANNLYEKGATVELTEKKVRTTGQNSYLHLILGVVALELGETLEYVKEQYFKRMISPDLFIVKRADKYLGEVETLRSSATLTKEEMSTAIDRFIHWADINGIYIPSPDEERILKEVEIELSRKKNWLWDGKS